MGIIKVDIADDHKVVLAGIVNLLNTFPNITANNLYENGMQLLKGLAKSQPDVLLLDIQMPDVSGEELTPLIIKKYPNVSILVMTGFDTTTHAKKLLNKGALGYLLKNTNENMLKEAIETVYRKQPFIDPIIKEKLAEETLLPQRTLREKPSLTRREKDIVRLIMQEKTSQEIATELNLSLRTVENQRVNLTQKLDVKNVVGLVKKVIEWELLEKEK